MPLDRRRAPKTARPFRLLWLGPVFYMFSKFSSLVPMNTVAHMKTQFVNLISSRDLTLA